MNQLTNQLINFLFPPLCVHCQREGAWLCPEAQRSITAEPVWSEPITLPHVDRVFIRGSYDCLVLQRLIHRLKYSYWSAANEVLPTILSPLHGSLRQLPTGTVIVPVPLHTRRIRERGFNQADLIAHSLQQLTGWQFQRLLQRHRYTKPQAQLSEKKRLTNIIDAFIMPNRLDQIPSSAILVDDVLTTGSTLSECAKILKTHGIQKVYACTLAKG